MTELALRSQRARRRTSLRGLSLMEVLMLLAMLAVIIAVAGSMFGRAWRASVAIRRNADEITRALHAGERWRTDVRTATGPLRTEQMEDSHGLVIPIRGGSIVWLVQSNALYRQAGPGQPEVWQLGGISRCAFAPHEDHGVRAWRCDVELQRRRSEVGVRPLFTFTAVPPGGAVVPNKIASP